MKRTYTKEIIYKGHIFRYGTYSMINNKERYVWSCPIGEDGNESIFDGECEGCPILEICGIAPNVQVEQFMDNLYEKKLKLEAIEKL